MIYFTSDWHLDHENIIHLCNRPFKDAQEMNKTILDNLFSVIKNGDTLYYLGDFAFSTSAMAMFFRRWDEQITSSIPIFMNGNHDKRFVEWLQTQHLPIKRLNDILNLKIEKQHVTLMHYPMLTFEKSHFGAWQLYGHHHNNTYHKAIPESVMGKKMNVGVDLHGFKPVSWGQVKEYMAQQPDNFDLLKKEERH